MSKKESNPKPDGIKRPCPPPPPPNSVMSDDLTVAYMYGFEEGKKDRDYWKRLAEAAGEVITYMEKSGMSIVPWNEIYKKYQSIKEGGK